MDATDSIKRFLRAAKRSHLCLDKSIIVSLEEPYSYGRANLLIGDIKQLLAMAEATPWEGDKPKRRPYNLTPEGREANSQKMIEYWQKKRGIAA